MWTHSSTTYQTTILIDALNRTADTFARITELVDDFRIAVERGPQFGWYSEFDQWPKVQHRPRELLLPMRPRRAQARACIKTARRWKRRRFVHGLRRSALV